MGKTDFIRALDKSPSDDDSMWFLDAEGLHLNPVVETISLHSQRHPPDSRGNRFYQFFPMKNFEILFFLNNSYRITRKKNFLNALEKSLDKSGQVIWKL